MEGTFDLRLKLRNSRSRSRSKNKCSDLRGKLRYRSKSQSRHDSHRRSSSRSRHRKYRRSRSRSRSRSRGRSGQVQYRRSRSMSRTRSCSKSRGRSRHVHKRSVSRSRRQESRSRSRSQFHIPIPDLKSRKMKYYDRKRSSSRSRYKNWSRSKSRSRSRSGGRSRQKDQKRSGSRSRHQGRKSRSRSQVYESRTVNFKSNCERERSSSRSNQRRTEDKYGSLGTPRNNGVKSQSGFQQRSNRYHHDGRSRSRSQPRNMQSHRSSSFDRNRSSSRTDIPTTSSKTVRARSKSSSRSPSIKVEFFSDALKENVSQTNTKGLNGRPTQHSHHMDRNEISRDEHDIFSINRSMEQLRSELKEIDILAIKTGEDSNIIEQHKKDSASRNLERKELMRNVGDNLDFATHPTSQPKTWGPAQTCKLLVTNLDLNVTESNIKMAVSSHQDLIGRPISIDMHRVGDDFGQAVLGFKNPDHSADFRTKFNGRFLCSVPNLFSYRDEEPTPCKPEQSLEMCPESPPIEQTMNEGFSPLEYDERPSSVMHGVSPPRSTEFLTSIKLIEDTEETFSDPLSDLDKVVEPIFLDIQSFDGGRTISKIKVLLSQPNKCQQFRGKDQASLMIGVVNYLRKYYPLRNNLQMILITPCIASYQMLIQALSMVPEEKKTFDAYFNYWTDITSIAKRVKGSSQYILHKEMSYDPKRIEKLLEHILYPTPGLKTTDSVLMMKQCLDLIIPNGAGETPDFDPGQLLHYCQPCYVPNKKTFLIVVVHVGLVQIEGRAGDKSDFEPILGTLGFRNSHKGSWFVPIIPPDFSAPVVKSATSLGFLMSSDSNDQKTWSWPGSIALLPEKEALSCFMSALQEEKESSNAQGVVLVTPRRDKSIPLLISALLRTGLLDKFADIVNGVGDIEEMATLHKLKLTLPGVQGYQDFCLQQWGRYIDFSKTQLVPKNIYKILESLLGGKDPKYSNFVRPYTHPLWSPYTNSLISSSGLNDLKEDFHPLGLLSKVCLKPGSMELVSVVLQALPSPRHQVGEEFHLVETLENVKFGWNKAKLAANFHIVVTIQNTDNINRIIDKGQLIGLAHRLVEASPNIPKTTPMSYTPTNFSYSQLSQPSTSSKGTHFPSGNIPSTSQVRQTSRILESTNTPESSSILFPSGMTNISIENRQSLTDRQNLVSPLPPFDASQPPPSVYLPVSQNQQAMMNHLYNPQNRLVPPQQNSAPVLQDTISTPAPTHQPVPTHPPSLHHPPSTIGHQDHQQQSKATFSQFNPSRPIINPILPKKSRIIPGMWPTGDKVLDLDILSQAHREVITTNEKSNSPTSTSPKVSSNGKVPKNSRDPRLNAVKIEKKKSLVVSTFLGQNSNARISLGTFPSTPKKSPPADKYGVNNLIRNLYPEQVKSILKQSQVSDTIHQTPNLTENLECNLTTSINKIKVSPSNFSHKHKDQTYVKSTEQHSNKHDKYISSDISKSKENSSSSRKIERDKVRGEKPSEKLKKKKRKKHKNREEEVKHKKIKDSSKKIDCDQPDSNNVSEIGKRGASFTCEFCSEKYNSLVSFERHKRNHHSFKCDMCPLSFTRNSRLEKHMYRHHNLKQLIEPNECGLCGCIFNGSTLLSQHILSSPHEFPCSGCTKRFTTKDVLVKHAEECSPLKKLLTLDEDSCDAIPELIIDTTSQEDSDLDHSNKTKGKKINLLKRNAERTLMDELVAENEFDVMVPNGWSILLGSNGSGGKKRKIFVNPEGKKINSRKKALANLVKTGAYPENHNLMESFFLSNNDLNGSIEQEPIKNNNIGQSDEEYDMNDPSIPTGWGTKSKVIGSERRIRKYFKDPSGKIFYSRKKAFIYMQSQGTYSTGDLEKMDIKNNPNKKKISTEIVQPLEVINNELHDREQTKSNNIGKSDDEFDMNDPSIPTGWGTKSKVVGSERRIRKYFRDPNGKMFYSRKKAFIYMQSQGTYSTGDLEKMNIQNIPNKKKVSTEIVPLKPCDVIDDELHEQEQTKMDIIGKSNDEFDMNDPSVPTGWGTKSKVVGSEKRIRKHFRDPDGKLFYSRKKAYIYMESQGTYATDDLEKMNIQNYPNKKNVSTKNVQLKPKNVIDDELHPCDKEANPMESKTDFEEKIIDSTVPRGWSTFMEPNGAKKKKVFVDPEGNIFKSRKLALISMNKKGTYSQEVLQLMESYIRSKGPIKKVSLQKKVELAKNKSPTIPILDGGATHKRVTPRKGIRKATNLLHKRRKINKNPNSPQKNKSLLGGVRDFYDVNLGKQDKLNCFKPPFLLRNINLKELRELQTVHLCNFNNDPSVPKGWTTVSRLINKLRARTYRDPEGKTFRSRRRALNSMVMAATYSAEDIESMKSHFIPNSYPHSDESVALSCINQQNEIPNSANEVEKELFFRQKSQIPPLLATKVINKPFALLSVYAYTMSNKYLSFPHIENNEASLISNPNFIDDSKAPIIMDLAQYKNVDYAVKEEKDLKKVEVEQKEEEVKEQVNGTMREEERRQIDGNVSQENIEEEYNKIGDCSVEEEKTINKKEAGPKEVGAKEQVEGNVKEEEKRLIDKNVMHEEKVEDYSSEEEEGITCHECEDNFQNPRELFMHNLQVHKMNWSYSANKQKEKRAQNPTSSTPKGPFKCNLCQEVINSWGPLSKHLWVPHLFACEYCPLKFVRATLLEDHINRVHDLSGGSLLTATQCDLCKESFARSASLLRHSKTPHRFPCEQCDQKFVTNSALKKHTHTHKQFCPKSLVNEILISCINIAIGI